MSSVAGRVGTALFIAWRNLTRERRRWLMSASALAVAAMIVLFLEGISRWLTVSSTAYLDHSGAQLVVSEKGIEDLLFAQSALPPGALAQLRSVPGVRAVDPVVSVNGIVGVGHTHLPVYLVGFQPRAGGGPWRLVSGSAEPSGAEIVVDRGFASITNVAVGGSINLFGHALRVVGISGDTNAAGDFFLFTPIDLAQMVAGTQTVSYGLVYLDGAVPSADVAAAINRIPGLEALPRATVAGNDQATIASSFGQPVEILVVVALVAGVLIAGIVLYTATVEHARDFAVLKAIGAGRLVLYGSALMQSLVLSVCGVLLGWGLAAALAAALDTWYPVIASNLDFDLVAKLAGIIVAVNLLASLLPVRYVRRIDPQEVFKA
ncbi:MAG: FtsX-like permease family protein [Chloroflexi bacterium]|nr:MAG: FtsX-like permease family protein [Chloroflexota bacterium]